MSENILILLSKQQFSLLFAYQRVTSLEQKKKRLVVIRVQGFITQHLTFSLCIPVGPVIWGINASFGSKLLIIPAKNLPHTSDQLRKAQRRRNLPSLLCSRFFNQRQTPARKSQQLPGKWHKWQQIPCIPLCIPRRENRFFLMFFQNKLAEDYWQHLHKTGKDVAFNTPIQAWNCFKPLQLFPSQHMGWNTGNKA